MKNNRIKLTEYILLAIVSSVLNTLFAFILSRILDLLVLRDVGLIVKTVIFGIIYLFVTILVSYALGILKNRLIVKDIKNRKMQIYEYYINLNYEEFHKETASSMLNQLIGNMSQYEELYLNTVLEFPMIVFSLIAAAIATIYIDYRLLYIMILFAVITIVLSKYVGKNLSEAAQKLLKANEEHLNKLKDHLSGYFLIHSYDFTDKSLDSISRNTEETLESFYEKEKAFLIMTHSSTFIGLLSTITIMGIAAIFSAKGLISIGMVLATSQLIGKIISPITSFGKIYAAYIAGKEIKASYDAMIPKNEHQDKVNFRNIELKNLSYSYDTDVLKNINFLFEKNKKYGIVGSVGCGKSTILKLIAGILRSDNVFYDGISQKNYSENQILKNIAFVPQKDYFFDDSIKNNICLFNDVDDNELEKTLKNLELNKWLESLTDGIDTVLSENGQSLSGGQRQKLSLARALLSQRDILLLDEYTSSMDFLTSESIQKYILSLNKTIIFVTHKKQSFDMKNADAILRI